LTNLRKVDLEFTQVTRRGVMDLQKALPQVAISLC
jgi:hypothetical protein